MKSNPYQARSNDESLDHGRVGQQGCSLGRIDVFAAGLDE